MKLLDSQLEFVPIMKRLEVDESVQTQVEPAYQNFFEDWSAANASRLNLWSAEERTESFTYFMVDRYLEAGKRQVQKPEDRQALVHGQMLWVKNEETGELEWKRSNSLDLDNLDSLTVVSPSLESHVKDLPEFVQTQSTALVIHNLESHGFLVLDTQIQDNILHVHALHPRGDYNVDVDLAQDASTDWTYQFKNLNQAEKPAMELPENALSENFGSTVHDITLASTQLQSDLMISLTQDDESSQKAADAVNASMAIFAVDRARQQVAGARLRSIQNVMSSKSERQVVENKFMAQTNRNKEQKKHYEERVEKAHKEQALAHQESQEKAARERREQRQSHNKKRNKWLAGALGLGAGSLATGFATTASIVHIVNFS